MFTWDHDSGLDKYWFRGHHTEFLDPEVPRSPKKKVSGNDSQPGLVSDCIKASPAMCRRAPLGTIP